MKQLKSYLEGLNPYIISGIILLLLTAIAYLVSLQINDPSTLKDQLAKFARIGSMGGVVFIFMAARSQRRK